MHSYHFHNNKKKYLIFKNYFLLNIVTMIIAVKPHGHNTLKIFEF